MPAELLGHRPEAREALAPELEFIPVGIDRFPNGMVVVRGTIDKKPMAFVFRAQQRSNLPTSTRHRPMRKERTLTSQNSLRFRLRKLIMAMVATSAFAGGCEDAGKFKSSDQSGIYGVQTGALTTDQLTAVNVTGQVAPWSTLYDFPGNFAEMNGKHYILLGSEGGPDAGSVTYIECDKLKDCFDVNAQRQHVEGVNELFSNAQIGNPPYYGASIYQDQNGNYKFLVQPAGDFAYKLDVAINPATGKLAVSNLDPNPFLQSGPSIVPEGGVPHALYEGNGVWDYNLIDNTEKKTALDNSFGAFFCGPPTLDGDLAVGSKWVEVQGVIQCHLVFAKTLDELATKAAPIVTLNNQIASKRLTNPRLTTDTDGSGILIYGVEDKYPGGGTQDRIWYALIPALPPAGPDAAGGDTSDADAGVAPADTGPEVDAVDAADSATDTADTMDSGSAPADVAAETGGEVIVVIDVPDAATSDVAPEVVPPADSGAPDVPPELPPVDAATPDTTPACTTTLPEFTLNTGNCTLTVCPKNIADLQGHTVDVSGDGSQICSADITVNGKPATLTLSNTANGQIKITCEIFQGESPLCDVGVDTTAEVTEQGAGTKLKNPQGITLGSSASHFLMTPRANGDFEVKSMNNQGEPPVVIKFLDGSTIEVPSDGKMYVVAANGKVLTAVDKPGEDAGQDIGQKDAGSIDASQPKIDISQPKADSGNAPEIQTSPDSGTPNKPQEPPKDTGGCSTTRLSESNPTGFGMILAAAALALATLPRRRAAEIFARARGQKP